MHMHFDYRTCTYYYKYYKKARRNSESVFLNLILKQGFWLEKTRRVVRQMEDPPFRQSVSHTSVNTSSHGSGRPQICPSKCQTRCYVASYSKRFCVSRVADGRDGLQVWSADAKTRNKQTWTTSRRRSSITGLGKVFSCCGWTRRPPDMEGGCENNE